LSFFEIREKKHLPFTWCLLLAGEEEAFFRLCGLDGHCYECYKNGEKHYLGYPVYDENDNDEIFQKFY